MSALFNQTNVAPGTSFAGSGGGGGPIPNNLSTVNVLCSSIVFTGPSPGLIETYNVSGWPGGVVIGSAGATNNLTANRYYFAPDASVGSYKQNYLDISGIVYQGQNTGSQIRFLNYVGSDTANEWFAVENTSTIKGPTGNSIGIIALASTLASVYPGCVG